MRKPPKYVIFGLAVLLSGYLGIYIFLKQNDKALLADVEQLLSVNTTKLILEKYSLEGGMPEKFDAMKLDALLLKLRDARLTGNFKVPKDVKTNISNYLMRSISGDHNIAKCFVVEVHSNSPNLAYFDRVPDPENCGKAYFGQANRLLAVDISD